MTRKVSWESKNAIPTHPTACENTSLLNVVFYTLILVFHMRVAFIFEFKNCFYFQICISLGLGILYYYYYCIINSYLICIHMSYQREQKWKNLFMKCYHTTHYVVIRWQTISILLSLDIYILYEPNSNVLIYRLSDNDPTEWINDFIWIDISIEMEINFFD